MIGHDICFKRVIWKIIPKLSLLLLLIWSTEFIVCDGQDAERQAVLYVDRSCYLCPGHEMAEGHIESYLSVCVCVFECVIVCVFQNCVRLIFSSCIMGYENNFAQMISTTRR